jgi:putative hemolysin
MKTFHDKNILSTLVILIAMVMTVQPVSAMTNPAAGYCSALGYTYSTQPDPQGNQVGYCTLTDGRSLYAWDFLLGETGQEHSWCVRNGYASRVVNDTLACRPFEQPSCLACVFPNGSAMEVTQAMGLDFREKVCFEDTCNDPKDSPPPRYLIPSKSKDSGSSLPVWAVPAGVLVVIIIIAGVIVWNTRKGKTS